MAVVAALSPGTARARPASTGWFVEGGLGAVAFLPKASKDAQPGPSLDLRIGRDLFTWLSVGITLAASSHEATTPPPPTGEWFQLYRAQADARLTARLNYLAVFVEGGAGAALISSNVLEKVGILDPGEKVGIAIDAGGGFEYQLQNRHYAFGLAGNWWVLPTFDHVQGAEARLYIRYTY